MKFPWNRRAEEERYLRAGFEKQLRDAQGRRPEATRAAAEIRRHDQLNGWTGTIATIFSASKPEGHRP